MKSSSLALKGIIHGKIIELDREAGLPDGQEVAVIVEPVTTSSPLRPGAFLSDETR
jgi:hypothetical protein